MMHIIICWYFLFSIILITGLSRQRQTHHHYHHYHHHIINYLQVRVSVCCPSLWPSVAAAERRSARAFESLALRTDEVTSLAEAWLMDINETAWRARYAIGYEAGVWFGGRCNEYQSGLYPGSLPSATSSQRKINIYNVRERTSAALCLLFQSQNFKTLKTGFIVLKQSAGRNTFCRKHVLLPKRKDKNITLIKWDRLEKQVWINRSFTWNKVTLMVFQMDTWSLSANYFTTANMPTKICCKNIVGLWQLKNK